MLEKGATGPEQSTYHFSVVLRHEHVSLRVLTEAVVTSGKVIGALVHVLIDVHDVIIVG